MYFIYTH